MQMDSASEFKYDAKGVSLCVKLTMGVSKFVFNGIIANMKHFVFAVYSTDA